ncbi:MAG: insulinase family protein [Firmicutes bacterium]|nr:insulinase family protein [Bacillota bacterium]
MNKLENKIINECLYHEVLDNGLNVYLMPRKNFNKQYAIFACDYGANDTTLLLEDKGEMKLPDGIAHFLEHKLFENEDGDSFAKFASTGASANAYTNYTTTAYLFSSTDNFATSLLNLLDFVQKPYFTDENVEKEKGIIAQEILMYEDDPEYQVYLNLLQGLYNNHPLRKNIAGSIESINKIDKDRLYLCYNSFYRPENMVLFLLGNFDLNKTLKLIVDNQSEKTIGEIKGVKKVFSVENDSINQEIIKKEMDVSEPLFNLGFKETKIPDNSYELVKQELAVNILIDLLIGKGTKLYQSLYNEGLIDNHFHQYYVLEKGYGYALMGGKSKDPDKLYQRIIKDLPDSLNKITIKDYQTIYKKNLGNYIKSFNSFARTASEFINYIFKGINYLDLLDIINDIELDYVIGFYDSLFREEKAVRSIVEH